MKRDKTYIREKQIKRVPKNTKKNQTKKPHQPNNNNKNPPKKQTPRTK